MCIYDWHKLSLYLFLMCKTFYENFKLSGQTQRTFRDFFQKHKKNLTNLNITIHFNIYGTLYTE